MRRPTFLLAAMVLTGTLDSSLAFERGGVGAYDRRLDRDGRRLVSVADALCEGLPPARGPEGTVYRGEIYPSTTAACRAKVADLLAETTIDVTVLEPSFAGQKRFDRVRQCTGAKTMIGKRVKHCR